MGGVTVILPDFFFVLVFSGVSGLAMRLRNWSASVLISFM
jgi:hypothetical protein